MALRAVQSTAGGAIAMSAMAWMGEQGASRATTQISSRSASMASSSLLESYTSRFLRQQRCTFTTKTSPPKDTISATAAPKASTVSEAAAAATTEKASSGGFVQWYEGYLETAPVRTKMVTGSILWGVGDAVAQVVPQVASGETSMSDLTYDWPRTGRASLFGFAFHAPASHVHFNFLEWMTVRANVTGLYIPVFKATMEQFVYWSWISNSMYHGCMGLMQGMNGTQIYDRIADVLWDTQKAQWVFWIPVQLLNFQFVPVRHQLNVVLVTSIVWTALLSAWYPPTSDDDKTKAIEDGDKEKTA